jgi:hypothetical protein
MITSIEQHFQMHSIAFSSAGYQTLTEVWTKHGF